MANAFVPQQQQPFGQPGFNAPIFQRSGAATDKKIPRHRRRRRQLNARPNPNFQQRQVLPGQPFLSGDQQQQFMPFQQQQQMQLPQDQQQQQQQMLPAQSMQPNQPYSLLPQQQQQQQEQQIPLPQQAQPNQQVQLQPQQLNPTLNPSYYQLPSFPSSGIFQDGQIYPTMDPEFSIQAQISSGPTGNGNYPTSTRAS